MTPAMTTIIARYRKYCEESRVAALAPGATAEEIAQRSSINAGSRVVTLGQPYLELAATVDGLAADGNRLYPLFRRVVTNRLGEVIDRMDIVAANQHWREVYHEFPEIDEFLIYGLGDLAFFVRHLPSGHFQHRSRTGPTVFFDCSSFEECIWEAFRYALDLGEFGTSEGE